MNDSSVSEFLKGSSFVLAILGEVVLFIAGCAIAFEKSDFSIFLLFLGVGFIWLVMCAGLYGFAKLIDNSFVIISLLLGEDRKISAIRDAVVPKENNKTSEAQNNKKHLEEVLSKPAFAADASSWVCTCGKVHPKFVSSCDCGVSKRAATIQK